MSSQKSKPVKSRPTKLRSGTSKSDKAPPSSSDPPRGRFRQSSADWWMLLVVLTSMVFIIAVDWLGATLLHRLFGPRDEDLLLEPITISVQRMGNEVELVTTSALSLAAIVVIVFVLTWVLTAFRQGSASRRRDRASPGEGTGLTVVQKLSLSIALVIFALALGWTSAGLERWLIGDLDTMETLSLAFSVASIALFVAVLGFLFWIRKVNRRPLRRYWLIIFLTVAGVLLTVTSCFIDWDIPAGLILLLLSLSWGYVLFQLVWSYAIPQNFSAHKKPPRQSHLISFVSNQNMKKPENGACTLDQFELLLRDSFDEDPGAADTLTQAARQWRKSDPAMQDAVQLPTDFVRALLNLLQAMHERIKGRKSMPQSVEDVIESIGNTFDKAAIAELRRSSCLALDLLAIHMVAKIWSIQRISDSDQDAKLSELIKAYQSLTGIQIKWLMQVVSAEYNLGLDSAGGEASPHSTTMREMTFVFSEAKPDNGEATGSFESIGQIAWLFEVMFREHYGLERQAPYFSVFLPEILKIRSARLSSLVDFIPEKSGAQTPADFDRLNPIGIDFLDYTQCSQAIVQIIRDLSEHPEDELAIDFTGGLKPTTMAAVFATTFSHATSQYVDTNDYSVYGFDMRYHDIRFLVS